MSDGRIQAIHYVSDHAISMIYPLWFSGKDTSAIAKALGLPEYEIANRLPKILQRGDEMKGIEWTEELTERLKTFYATGISSSQIAAEMNCGISRNAVIGKVSRMGLVRDNGYGSRGRAPRHQPYKPRPKRSTPFLVPRAFNAEEAAELRCVEVEPRHVSLIDLEPTDCRWPYGDGPYTHCGNPQHNGSSYCGPHFYLSVGRGMASERTATRVTPRHLEAFA